MKNILLAALAVSLSVPARAGAPLQAMAAELWVKATTLEPQGACAARVMYEQGGRVRIAELSRFIVCVDGQRTVEGISYHQPGKPGEWKWISQEQLLANGYAAIYAEFSLQLYAYDKSAGEVGELQFALQDGHVVEGAKAAGLLDRIAALDAARKKGSGALAAAGDAASFVQR